MQVEAQLRPKSSSGEQWAFRYSVRLCGAGRLEPTRKGITNEVMPERSQAFGPSAARMIFRDRRLPKMPSRKRGTLGCLRGRGGQRRKASRKTADRLNVHVVPPATREDAVYYKGTTSYVQPVLCM